MKALLRIILFCLFCLNLCAQEEGRLDVLILGGTTFLGPRLTTELLKHGHTVTHFNRGNAHDLSFPEVTQLTGNRHGDLKPLEGQKWDAIIDTSGYLPRIVEASSQILASSTRHYTLISTISVYEEFSSASINEESKVAPLKDPQEEEITSESYGPLKAACERVVETYFPNRCLIIRPGIIVGPYDSTDRFTYWVRRLAVGGQVVIPNGPDHKLQLIDVRDLAKWIVKMIENQEVGTFNATGPKEDLTFDQMIKECSRFSRSQLDLIKIDEQTLIDHHYDAWTKLPFWISHSSRRAGIFNIDSSKAQKRGLTYRPLHETIFDTLKWDDQRTDRSLRVGLLPEEEAALVTAM